MPRYDYECSECGHKAEEIHSMNTVLTVCPACEKPVYQKQISAPFLHTEFARPIEMYSVACNSKKQIRAMQEAGVTISDDPRSHLYGVPVANNRPEKMRALKAAGFIERN